MPSIARKSSKDEADERSPVFGEDADAVDDSMPKLSKKVSRPNTKGGKSNSNSKGQGKTEGKQTKWVAKDRSSSGSAASTGEETAWNLGAKLNKSGRSNSKGTDDKKTPYTEASTAAETKRKDSGSKSWFWRATPKKLNVD